MKKREMELVEKEVLTIEEFEELSERYDYTDNGESSSHYNHHWYTILDEDGIEYDVYVPRY